MTYSFIICNPAMYPDASLCAYKPSQERKYQRHVQNCVLEQGKPKELLKGDLHVSIAEYSTIPKAFGKTKRIMAMSGAIRPSIRSDIGYIAASIFNALNGLVWVNEAKVAHVALSRHYSDAPRLDVTVKEIQGAKA